jgi:hypothetical protein
MDTSFAPPPGIEAHDLSEPQGGGEHFRVAGFGKQRLGEGVHILPGRHLGKFSAQGGTPSTGRWNIT